MKIPRNISGNKLAKLLEVYGYRITRQVGSHMRLTTFENGQHHITIPNHDPIKVGTLSAILLRISQHHNITKSELVDQLF